MAGETSQTKIERVARRVSCHKNILIVEDDADTAETIMFILAMEGYGVRTVRSRDEAVIAIRHNLYNIVLLDFFMPGLSAEKFLNEAARVSPLTKIVLITAAPQAEEKAAALGLTHWLGKPFSHKDLIEGLAKIE